MVSCRLLSEVVSCRVLWGVAVSCMLLCEVSESEAQLFMIDAQDSQIDPI